MPKNDERGVRRALQSPTWVSRIVLLVGLSSVLSAFLPGVSSRTRLVHEMVPAAFPAAATTGAAAIGLILVALSRALRRGKFRAWLVALVLSALAVVLHLLKGLQVEEATLCLLLVVLLATSRRNFTARPDPRSTGRLLVVLTAGPVLATILGYVWLALDGDGQTAGTTTGQRIAQALLGLVGIPGPMSFISSGASARAAIGLVVLGAAVLLVAVITAMEPADGPHALTAEESGRVRALIEKWGWVDSLAYFSTRDDRSVIFSPSGQAAVSYRVIGSVSFAAGDPLGNPADWPEAIRAWLDEARSYGWTPANLGCSERGAAAYHRAGLEILEIGDEAVVHACDFSLEGRSMRGVRQAVARVSRAGISACCHRVADLPAERRAELREKAVAWREGTVERGFSMALGRFGEVRDDRSVVVVASKADGELVGLLSFAPWGDDALSLDLMRRTRESENGIVELMVTTLMLESERLGISKISLNFAAFRGVFARGERLGAGPTTRACRAVLLWASHFAQIESLYRSNSKYQPEWVPRFVAFPRVTDIPKVGTAALRAEALLVAPGWYRRLTGHDRRHGIDQIPQVAGTSTGSANSGPSTGSANAAPGRTRAPVRVE